MKKIYFYNNEFPNFCNCYDNSVRQNIFVRIMQSTSKLFAIITGLLLLSVTVNAQSILNGMVSDIDDGNPLIGATIKLTSLTDTTEWQGTVTDLDGKFEFRKLKEGPYKIIVNYIGYIPIEREVYTNNTDRQLGLISLSKKATTLKDVNIVENQVRVIQKTDTSEYNANAFKTNKDATTEDLVTKMPGITSEGGVIKAQGEEVKKVLIDGKEFFGDDAALALKNLPSEVVDRVQVFDRMNDQSSFTGFDDGNSQKAMNIVTKNGANNLFGKVYAGYGYLNDSRYSVGGNINWFKDNRRISAIGMSNNVNQQNFSSQDLIGLTGATQRGGGRPRAGRTGGIGNSASNNFMVGQQEGNSTTHSAGVNYSDIWGKRNNVKVTGNYFFNLINNTNSTELNRNYLNTSDSSTTYRETNNTHSRNMNHRISWRLEYVIDSMNTLIFTPKFNYQDNSQTNVIDGQNTFPEGVLLSRTQSNYKSDYSGYNSSGDLLYQHNFKRLYRTISVNVGTTINNKFGSSTQNARNSFQNLNDSSMLDQQSDIANTSYKINGNVTYTEPAGKSGMVQLSYEPSHTWNKADKETFNRDSASSDYSLRDTFLSNKFDNNYMTHRGNASYRVKSEQFNITIGLSGQYALLTGNSIFPYVYSTSRSFYNLLPTATFNYKFKDKSNFRVIYRTSTNAPSISQLQNVIDNSNPLLLSTGNPDLKQSYNHFIMARYGYTNTKKGQTFFAFTSANYTQNYIGNSTIIATEDTLLNDEVLLRTGSQLKQPININSSLNINSFFTYGLPINKIKSSLNLNAGFTFAGTPGFINNEKNLSKTYGINGGLVLSSNISEKIDFTIGYNANYNIVKNTLQINSDNNYFIHNANVKFNWEFWKGFVFNTGLQNTLYTGVSSGFNQNIFLWNAALGYKFLKDQSLDVRLSVNDILNQNNGISRNITETYIEDTKTEVLKRYLLLTITYTFKQSTASGKKR
ncbi:MAG: TonB-dependent receptor [Bacteroidota bacterium]